MIFFEALDLVCLLVSDTFPITGKPFDPDGYCWPPTYST